MTALGERLAQGPPLLMDGALGTELERRGVATSGPLWSSRALYEAPDAVGAVHRDYYAAGAEVAVACTFRAHRRALRAAGRDPGAHRSLTELAVRLARDAGPGYVLGSIGPLEDCFEPERVPDDAALLEEHSERAAVLSEAGVDGLLIETMCSAREATRAVEAAQPTGLSILVSWVVDEAQRLLDGTPLDRAIAMLPALPAALLVNCTTVAAAVGALGQLARPGVAFGAYPNAGYGPPRPGGAPPAKPPAPAAFAHALLAGGPRLVGGCCGTTPAYIAALRRGLS